MVLPVSKVQIFSAHRIVTKNLTLTPGSDTPVPLFSGLPCTGVGWCSKQCRGTGTSDLRDNSSFACVRAKRFGQVGPARQRGQGRAHASAGMLGARHGKKSEFGCVVCVFVGVVGGARTGTTGRRAQQPADVFGRPYCIVDYLLLAGLV